MILEKIQNLVGSFKLKIPQDSDGHLNFWKILKHSTKLYVILRSLGEGVLP